MTHTYQSKNYVFTGDDPGLIAITPTTGATLLVVGITKWDDVERGGGAPTFNGVAMTRVGTVEQSSETNIELWYLLDPSIGTFNISVPNTNSDDIALHASVYAAQAGYTTEFDIKNQTNAATGSPTINITPTANGDAVIDIMASGDGTIASANSQTLLHKNDQGGWVDGSQYALQASAAQLTFSYTVPSDDWSIIVAAFKEVPPAVTGHPWFYERKQ